MSEQDKGYIVTEIGGNCPVQAEGMVDGLPFYFRARYSSWSFSVARDAKDDPVLGNGFCYEEEYPGGEFAAGWMTEEEARRFIDKAARMYFAQRRGSGRDAAMRR